MFGKGNRFLPLRLGTGLALGLAIALAGGCATFGQKQAERQQAKMTGEQVYKGTCSACHDTGLNGAPRYQDKAAWGKLLEEGQVILSAHGWVGLGGMPPQGGNPNLTLEEFSRAVAFMGRGVGSDWQDPTAEMLAEIENEIVVRRKELAEKPH